MAQPTLLYRLLNPVVIALLRSPLHPILSGNTLVLEYEARRSGRRLRTPISYHQDDSGIHAFASVSSQWWRNLAARPAVRLTLAGHTMQRHATIGNGDAARIAPTFAAFLRAVPRDAKVSGVRLDAHGEPHAADVLRAAERIVHIRFRAEG